MFIKSNAYLDARFFSLQTSVNIITKLIYYVKLRDKSPISIHNSQERKIKKKSLLILTKIFQTRN